MNSSSRHKTMLITWLVVYPMITGLLAILEPALGELALPLKTLIVTLIMVPAMVYVAMPFAISQFRRWL